MTLTEAYRNVREFYNKSNPNESDEFILVESLSFIIEEEKNPDAMVDLGGFYYGKREFDLALKYYEMAAEYDQLDALIGLGYIWYYGRTGQVDYKKAFEYYSKAKELGDMVAAYKVADMYRNGYYVEKNKDVYKEIILSLYKNLNEKESFSPFDSIPEVFTRLAGIYTEEGNIEKAIDLYRQAKDLLEYRIHRSPFFGNITIMKYTVKSLYSLCAFCEEEMDIYDCFYLMENQCRVKFWYEEKQYTLFSEKDEDGMGIGFEGVWYRSIDDFFNQAQIDGERVTTRCFEFYDYEVEYDNHKGKE